MKLAYWMYAGPAHLGTLRVASSFKNVHAIMHAPLGDDYFNVMRSMLERERDFTPVTASIVDRHVLARGSQEKVVENITRKDKEEHPDLILLTPTCTSSILQEDLQNFVNRASLESSSDVILADVNHYRVNELQAADRTLEQIVRFYIEKDKKQHNKKILEKTKKPSANILGIFTLGFHNQHDCREIKRLLADLNIEVNQVIPEGGSVTDLKDLPKAWFNIVPYREVGLMTANYLEKEFQMPFISITPMGIQQTSMFIYQIQEILEKLLNTKSFQENLNFDQNTNFYKKYLDSTFYKKYVQNQTTYISQAAWFSRSIDCQNLTGKKTVVFGDATHAAAMTKILTTEMGIHVVCAGTYCKHDADWFREQVLGFCDQVLITDDHSQVGDMIARLEPAAIFGTQMERHVGKRLEIPCGVISAPVHIQNFPLAYRPFLGFEGTNQLADLVYNSFTLGMEDHLLEIFNGHDTKEITKKSSSIVNDSNNSKFEWSKEALQELSAVPGFVRGKVKRNVEKFALENNHQLITLDIMFDAKEAVNA
uniref:Light-independent protochlorophyllide reductase subunit B n=1 Tax=Chlorotetraedron incus TaxID=162317 RepID=A0A140HAB8_9CHLO|nr:protochlorophyllide reductase subunit B [Chlorotetraedron incus]AMO01117.1 protochlorophyllide reductase subunit B [Chlorotetraedron incus]